jgi:hypothetical protein
MTTNSNRRFNPPVNIPREGKRKMEQNINNVDIPAINPETIVPSPEQAAVDALVDSYRQSASEQAAKNTRLEEQAMGMPLPTTTTTHYDGLANVIGQVTSIDPIDDTLQDTPWEPPLVSNSIIDKAKRYELQESKRAPKIQVDQKVILLAWIIAVGIAFISSAIVSFNGITAVAAFVGLSGTWMSGLFFFFIELMYMVFLVAYLVLASRVDDDGKPEKTWGAMAGMVAFGGIAVLANGFHTLDFWAWDVSNPQVWAGLVLSVAAPIAIISASKMASRVVFARALKL